MIERALAVPWLRRPIMLIFGLMVAAYPIWVMWSFGVRRDFRVTTIIQLAWVGVSFAAFVATLALVAPSMLGIRRVAALIVLVPVIGGIFAVWWFWRLRDMWRPPPQET